jgi:hypothetical protein
MQELGCPEPRNGTKAAVAGWLRLRKECGVYLALRKQLASAHEKLVQAGKVAAIQLPPATASGPAHVAHVPVTPATADKGGSFRNNDGLPAAAPSTKQQTIADRKPPGQKTGGLNIGFKDMEEKGGKAEKEKAKPKKTEKRKAETTAASTRKKRRG